VAVAAVEAIGVEEASTAEQRPAKSKARTVGHLRGMDAAPNSDDEVVEGQRPYKKKQSQLDFFFRKFEYRKAIEFIVLPSTEPRLGLAGVDELLRRGALAGAMSELGEDLCLAALRWLLNVFGLGDSLQQQLFMEALHTLLDHNRCLQPPSTPALIDALERLENKVNQELKVQEVLMETSGMLRSVTTL